MVTRRSFIAFALVLSCLAGPGAQAPHGDEAVWKGFMAWFEAAPPARPPAHRGNPIAAYAASLRAAGTPEAEVERQSRVLMRLIMGGRADWVELFYDKVFAGPQTGDPANGGLTTTPSAIVVEAVKGLTPGTALDAGMGQGRNAVYLAGQGWRVTGFDVSGEAIKSATTNAERAAVRIDAVKATHADFDFGVGRWDLIILTFAWAPLTDPAFVARLRTSLRPNGRLVIEHFLEEEESPRPPAMQALKPGQLRGLLEGLRLDRYEELTGLADWGGPGTRLVRAVAVKS